MKKTITTAIIAGVAFASSAQAQLSNVSGGLMLGGGYLEDPEKAYLFGQFRGTFYEDDAFSHTAFLEILGHTDDATLSFNTPGGTVFEDGDVTFINITANYELEAKLFGPISVYAGAGIGAEIVTVDDRFDIELDSDTNFVAQVFMGLRADFQNGFLMQAGARYLMREDFSLLGDQFVTEDSWAFEIGVGLQF
ncbi:hypothetical protein AAFN60_08615 [Roseibacillus persicicus]|uniref:Outer membrane protein beta-barrel domain-containing protein n=1 Tax=Roseibacillus persicicus TaxID=454148 RepID=A0A918TQ22_9BACT|nr:hypothetical protein [Roseibacillus persicicus]GHC57121.1 hypothetical protein GCM10007100_24980 [Roseibacillus persicicus]